MKPMKNILLPLIFFCTISIFLITHLQAKSNCLNAPEFLRQNTMRSQSNFQPSNVTMPLYLSKNDPIYIQIKARALNDFKEAVKRSDPNTEENKLKKAKLNTLSEEKQNKYNEAFIQSLRDYTSQLDFDFGIFMMVFIDFDLNGLNKFMNESDFRVRLISGNKYAAEYWEDGILTNSDENAIIWANTIMKRYPNNKEALKEVRENYANTRKLMLTGKKERYTKTMAFLYTKEKDGTVLFHHPGQEMYDFK